MFLRNLKKLDVFDLIKSSLYTLLCMRPRIKLEGLNFHFKLPKKTVRAVQLFYIYGLLNVTKYKYYIVCMCTMQTINNNGLFA